MVRADVFNKFLDALRKTQFLPPDQLLQHQREQLESIVRHARAHVPFYRDTGRLNQLFRSDDTIDWDRWGDVPLLTRKEVQQAGDSLCSEVVPREHGKSFPITTSGSTSEPVTVWHTQLSNPMVRAAVVVRNLERQGVDPSQRLAMLYPFTPAEFDTRRARRHPGGYDSYSEPGLTGERFDLAETRPAGELIDELVAMRPKFLRVRPVVLELLCAYDSDRRLSELDIAVVFSVSEYLPQEVKRDVAEHLGCWIVDMYGSVECGRMANSCPECGRFHVEAETVLVEVNGENGMPTEVGETGWVIATPFYNYAMPLIRYDHADQAVAGPIGGCSITLPTLQAVLGKERATFVLPGGVVIQPTVPPSAAVKYLGAQAFQVAQVAEDRCEFRIVPGRLAPSEMNFEEMTRLIRSMWWSGLQIDYRIVSELPSRSVRGKVAAVVREFTPEDAPRGAYVRSAKT
jgi:phenylacetate-CoA ligase